MKSTTPVLFVISILYTWNYAFLAMVSTVSEVGSSAVKVRRDNGVCDKSRLEDLETPRSCMLILSRFGVRGEKAVADSKPVVCDFLVDAHRPNV